MAIDRTHDVPNVLRCRLFRARIGQLLLFIGLIYLLALVTPRNGGPPSDRERRTTMSPTYKPGANAMELADPFSPQSTPKHSFQTNP
jgi:hypothetical protein